MSEQAETHRCVIHAVERVTHDVRRFVVEKPDGYDFEPGQATEVSIDKEGWRDEARPFTFTSLPGDPLLEFTIKIYPDHDGVTEQLGELKVDDALLLRDVWGAIQYTGPGTFIAGGAGVTPFIAILRDRHRRGDLAGNKLLFSNKTSDDIILGGEFVRMLAEDAVFTLTREENASYHQGRIDEAFIEEHGAGVDQPFYVCGPPEMVEDITGVLEKLGASTDDVVIEE